MGARDSEILRILNKRRRAEVSELACALGVSEVTMRKDLSGLERRGIIQRAHGFALLASRDDVNGRLAYHYDEKLRIARRAAELVSDGDTVMVENGSCCALLVAELSKARRDVQVVTNSAFIADYVRSRPEVRITLLGGDYQDDAQVTVGPMLRRCAEEFCVDRLFIGVDGWSASRGFTNADQLRAEAVRDMARQAESVVVLTESEKFSRRGTVPLRLGSAVTCVVTDPDVPADARAALEAAGAEVVLAG